MAVVKNGGAFTFERTGLPSGNITVSAWIKFNQGTWDSFEAYGIILDIIDAGSWEAWLQFFAEPSTGEFRIWHSPAEHEYEDGAPTNWFHVALVNNGTNTIVYARAATDSSYTVLNSQTQQTFARLFGFRSESDQDHPADASMGYLRVHSSGLTTTQLMAESQSKTAVVAAWADWPLSNLAALGTDISGNNRPLTLTSAGSATAETDDPIQDAAPPLEIEGVADGDAVGDVSLLASATLAVDGVADGDATGAVLLDGSLPVSALQDGDARGALLLSGALPVV